MRALTRITGWSFLRCHFRLHHRGQLSAPTGPKPRDRRSTPCPHLQDRQHHLRRRHPSSPSVVRSSTHDRPGSSHPIRKSRCFPPIRITRDARQAMVEPIRIDRHTRDRRRALPGSAAETQRDSQLVFRICNGGATVDVTGCVVAARLRPLPIPLGDRHHNRIGHPWGHFIRHHLLLFRYRGRGGIRKLPLSNPRVARPSLSYLNGFFSC